MNVFAAWRLVSILQHQVGTYPVDDPTWYGPITIILAVLEVDSASICASVPVFWPVLSKQLGKIFVTREFAVTREDRLDYETINSPRTIRSNFGSEVELQSEKGTAASRLGKPGAKDGHYDDAFIMSQVNPLAKTSHAAVEGGRKDRPKRNWLKF